MMNCADFEINGSEMNCRSMAWNRECEPFVRRHLGPGCHTLYTLQWPRITLNLSVSRFWERRNARQKRGRSNGLMDVQSAGKSEDVC